jgi:hypothetical protein
LWLCEVEVARLNSFTNRSRATAGLFEVESLVANRTKLRFNLASLVCRHPMATISSSFRVRGGLMPPSDLTNLQETMPIVRDFRYLRGPLPNRVRFLTESSYTGVKFGTSRVSQACYCQVADAATMASPSRLNPCCTPFYTGHRSTFRVLGEARFERPLYFQRRRKRRLCCNEDRSDLTLKMTSAHPIF